MVILSRESSTYSELGLIRFCGIVKNKKWNRYPRKIHCDKKRRNKKIRYQSDDHATGAKDNTKDPSDDRVIFIERFEKMTHRNFERERTIRRFNSRHKAAPDRTRTVNIPVVKKIKNPVEKPLSKIDDREIGEIHALIIPRKSR